MVDIRSRRLLWMYCPAYSGVKGNDLAGKHHKWLATRKILRVEVLETLPAGTNQGYYPHRSPGGERRRKSKHLKFSPETTMKYHRQSNKNWNSFKSDIGRKTFDRQGGRIWAFPCA